MHSGLGGGRPRVGDAFGQHMSTPALFTPDERASGYDSLSRFDQMRPSAMQSPYMLDGSQTWGYNGSGLATVNGPMNGTGRLGSRAVNRRAALPSVSFTGVNYPCQIGNISPSA